ncbi:MAG: FKBP-type peptidyl-prolyl cis-trans isomerase [Bacteroidota bacterium]
MRYSFLLLLALVTWSSCTSKLEKRLTAEMIESPQNQAEKDKNQILKYALSNKLDVRSTESGLYYFIEKQGTEGRKVSKEDIILAHYEGSLLDGKVFDSSYKRNQPFEFRLGRVIKGWNEGIPLLDKGAKGVFLIPSEMAYGKRGAGKDIPPNSVLRFDIELIDYYSPEEARGKRKAKEKKQIVDYVKAKGWTNVQTTASGIHYIIEKVGEGDARPDSRSKVKAHYSGSLLDGTVFDSSYKRNEPLSFKLGGVIKGWQEAIPLLGKGGKGKFVIPSEIAYGERGAGGVIPPNSVLVFEIELLDF